MFCDLCGHTMAPVSKVIVKGRDYNGVRRQKTLKICSCCDAFGATSDIQKMIDITEIDFDEDTVKII